MPLIHQVNIRLGQYITPLRYDGQDGLYGCVYDQDYALIPESLRDCSRTRKRHRDPFYLHPDEAASSIAIEGNVLFLGHHFNHYGHFVLESLPMISYLLDDSESTGIFLGFSGRTNSDILNSFLQLLGINEKRIIVHDSNELIKADVKVIPRPLAINHRLHDRLPYEHIISRLLLATESSGSLYPRHVFLERDAGRVDPVIHKHVTDYFAGLGYAVLKPELLDIKEQITIYQNAETIAGFFGSQMHNCIFCRPGTRVIILGDMRTLRHITANQKICHDIGLSKCVLVPYGSDMISYLQDSAIATI